MKKTVMILALVLIAVLSLTLLVSCGPNSNPDKAAATLKEKGYLVIYTKRDDLGAAMGKLDYKIIATNGDDKVTISWYQNADDAKAEYDNISKDLKSGWQAGYMNKMVWIGTNQAVKDAK